MQLPVSTVARQHFIQNAYHVADIDAAMAHWNRLFGLGPFLVRRHIALHDVTYRGQPGALDISAAHVQAGAVQIELVQQHCANPSTFRDMFAPDEEGLHHVAILPDDHAALVNHYAGQGAEVVTDFTTGEGRGASYVDARRTLGHMVEIYKVNDSLIEFYAAIAEAARNWDGRRLVIEV